MEIYKNPQYTVEERVDDLLQRMTLDEKIGQMRMVSGREYPTEKDYLQDIRAGNVGFRIGFFSPWQPLDWITVDLTELNRQQKTAVEESRLGIPIIVGLDVIHGHRTVAPIPLAQAAAWDPELIRQSAAMAAREAASQGVHWTFAPMVDITHDPRWGRVIETFGEDPYLAGILAAAAVNGFQSTNPNPRECLRSCVKHFAGYGYAEGGRDYDCSEISKYTLFNMVLPPFKAAVDAGVNSLMSSFQVTNGTPSSSSEFLLREVLRKKWHFDGVVVSDYNSTEQVEFHGAAQDEFDAAAKAFQAGINVEMVANLLNKYGKKLLDSGHLSLTKLDEYVRAILRMKFRAGLFEQPYTDPKRRDELLFCDAHRKLVRTQAAAGMVLAKNKNHILPLDRNELKKSQKKIIICGPMIYERSALQGAWALGSQTSTTATLAEAFREIEGVNFLIPECQLSDAQLIFAAECDLIICCVGESYMRTGEARNITRYELPPGQNEFIAALTRLGKPMIVVCTSGRPLPIPPAEVTAEAILYSWHGGSECARAVCDVISGDAEPGGRFPITVPRCTGQIPIYYNRKFPGKTIEFQPRYNYYCDDDFAPLYPFGFGLGYTAFEISDVTAPPSINCGESLPVRARVRNIGSRRGSCVLQCYIADPRAEYARPMRELAGFSKFELAPNESVEMIFTVAPESLGYYSPDGEFLLEKGEIKIAVGLDSTAEFTASTQLV